jgi:uncharacterized circularly permuted ATP-grasp superfamily protein/uncharacterized alpha-E superfamily protein
VEWGLGVAPSGVQGQSPWPCLSALTTTRLDEMVDGRGGLRPHWRQILGAFTALGEHGTAERISRLDQAFEEEGVSSLLPGSVHEHAWRCDPVPLPIAAAEFAALEAALAQRARLMEAILQDIYGAQTLLAEGLLPPALVQSNPAFLRACQVLPSSGGAPRFPLLHQYAVDMLRGPDGQWRVLADRTAGASGVAYARENRRILGRVIPEAFRSMQLRALRPFFDTWQDSLQRLAPQGRTNPAIGILTPGSAHPGWFEHMYLSRELSCVLVEGGDLTVREGILYLKTLRGLQQMDVLMRRVDGRLIDPLELEVHGGIGVTGLMDAVRHRNVRVLNDPGSGMVEAPALAAFLPQLSLRLLGERLELPSVPTMWLGQTRAREMVEKEPARWLIRPATDGLIPAILPGELPEDQRRTLLEKIARRPWDWAASAWMPPSQAPCGTESGLVPKPIVLRMFLVFDGGSWHTMPGGLAQVVEDSARIAGRLPRTGMSKDVWVMTDENADIVGPAALAVPRMRIHRASAEIPSRVADNLFWLGRYMERLEDSARLVRSVLRRLGRISPSPRDLAEMQALSRCLHHAAMIEKEAKPGPAGTQQLTNALLRSVKETGRVQRQMSRISHLTEAVRDRLTDDMYATITHMLRDAQSACTQVGTSQDKLGHAMTAVMRFSAAVAGVAAENMVRGGGWLFLDLGRRIERAQEICAEVAFALDQPVSRLEGGLRLALELCDSAITYRSRYMTVLQPATVLDLVLADTSNPRALAFQLAGMRTRLTDIISGPADPADRRRDELIDHAGALLTETQSLVDLLTAHPDPAAETARLPARLRAIEGRVSALSDRINRRYFAVLPTPQPLGVVGEPEADEEAPKLKGAA